MAHNRGKEVVDDEEYHSQPAPKASKWIFQKWRRQPKETSENASSSNPPEDKTEKTAEDLEEIPQKKRNWAIPNEDSNKWSQDVVEFYNNGDAPFCYSIFFKDRKLDGDFWGTLLGYRCNGQLWPMHIEGWVTRMMHFRDARLRTNGPSDKRDRHLKVHNVNDDYAPKDGGDLGGDTGVLACMLMQQLVQNKNLNVDDDFKNKCMKYRRYMAEQYYNWRFIPRG
ncbi:hypothetical protein E3N88_42368 [Mikania micrantha]|uniref:Uncharacterized protein n=1 Tax=Mikania micrantha TaxID=192012 RepID=A0A5N6LHZ9_9ASTR|nr:hypothetical protein E3N88_42368 [Mikania micrantha]